MTSRKPNGKFEPNKTELPRTVNGIERVKKPYPDALAKNAWKPGQTGNIAGRPKVKNTIKEQLRYELEREMRIHTTKGEMHTKAVRQVARNLISLLAFGEITFPSKSMGGRTRTVRFSGNDWANHAVKILKYYEPGDEKIKEQKNYINFDIMAMLPADVKENIMKVQQGNAEADGAKALPSVIEGSFVDESEIEDSRDVEEQWWQKEQEENDEEAKLMMELIEDGVEIEDDSEEEEQLDR